MSQHGIASGAVQASHQCCCRRCNMPPCADSLEKNLKNCTHPYSFRETLLGLVYRWSSNLIPLEVRPRRFFWEKLLGICVGYFSSVVKMSEGLVFQDRATLFPWTDLCGQGRRSFATARRFQSSGAKLFECWYHLCGTCASAQTLHKRMTEMLRPSYVRRHANCYLT